MKRRDFITLLGGAAAWPWVRPLTPEQEIVAALERCYGRKLTDEEMHLSLKQARAIGDLG